MKSEFSRIEALAEAAVKDHPLEATLPIDILVSMEENGVRPEEIAQIVAAPDELDRRRRVSDSLTLEQTDRAVRLAHIVSMAERVFGSREKAFFWLRLPNAQLDGKRPIEYLTRETGARFVEEMLVPIDHGIAA